MPSVPFFLSPESLREAGGEPITATLSLHRTRLFAMQTNEYEAADRMIALLPSSNGSTNLLPNGLLALSECPGCTNNPTMVQDRQRKTECFTGTRNIYYQVTGR